MGTYHSNNVQGEATGNPNGSKTLTREGVRAVFDYCLNHPEEGLARVARKHGLGPTTPQVWLTAPANLQPNKHLVEWFKQGDHLARWRLTRPRNRPSDRLVQAIGEVYQYPTEPEPVDVGHERLVGPTGIGTFVPGTTDDLLVIKEEALKVKADAEAVATEATILVVAIDTIRDWLTDKDRLQQALGRVQSLEAQLKASDAVLTRFRQQKLATDQVHSRD
jgi:hypothetical protein